MPTARIPPALRRFLRDRSGGVAVAYVLCLVPLVGLGGAALDHSRAGALRTFAQATTDAAALAAAMEDKPQRVDHILAQARERIRTAYGSHLAADVLITGRKQGASDYQVEAAMTLRTTLLATVPGLPKGVVVDAVSVARRQRPVLVSDRPRTAFLDPEAGDYNRIAAYCFDPERRTGPDGGRSHMTVLGDNGGTTYSYTMPRCREGETYGYRLTNVRGARARPDLWDSAAAERYEYYSDTTLTAGNVLKFNFNPALDVVESVICDTFEACKSRSQGGILPEGKDRQPVVMDRPCEAGKYLYLGWEDRPPRPWHWSDRDYDDIRIVISCPRLEAVGGSVVRLVR